jgi:predicted DNA-binding transcriptional regulator AlpA
MSLLTSAFILEKFGVRLTMAQLATLLAMSEGTIRNQVSAETFPIPTYKEGAARYAAYDAVAEYLDEMSKKAREKATA